MLNLNISPVLLAIWFMYVFAPRSFLSCILIFSVLYSLHCFSLQFNLNTFHIILTQDMIMFCCLRWDRKWSSMSDGRTVDVSMQNTWNMNMIHFCRFLHRNENECSRACFRSWDFNANKHTNKLFAATAAGKC